MTDHYKEAEELLEVAAEDGGEEAANDTKVALVNAVLALVDTVRPRIPERAKALDTTINVHAPSGMSGKTLARQVEKRLRGIRPEPVLTEQERAALRNAQQAKQRANEAEARTAELANDLADSERKLDRAIRRGVAIRYALGVPGRPADLPRLARELRERAETAERRLERITNLSAVWKDNLVSQIHEIARGDHDEAATADPDGQDTLEAVEHRDGDA